MDIEETGRAIKLVLRERDLSKKELEETKAIFIGADWTPEQTACLRKISECKTSGEFIEIAKGMNASDVAAFIKLNLGVFKKATTDTDRIDFLARHVSNIREVIDKAMAAHKGNSAT